MIIRKLRVNGGEYEQVNPPHLIPGMSLYGGMVLRKGVPTPVYSRTASGPFVFQVPQGIKFELLPAGKV